MKLTMTYQQIDPSEALNTFVENKIKRFDKFISKSTQYKWIFSRDGNSYKAAIQFQNGNQSFNYESHDHNVYKSVTKVVNKLKHAVKETAKKRSRKRYNKFALAESKETEHVSDDYSL